VKCIIASQPTRAARRLASLLSDLSPENEWELKQLSADHLPDADFIFLFRWPFIISDKVRATTRAKVVVFHTSELPKGRGGSPLQNQIAEGKYISRVNAIEMKKGVDSGDIYASQDITLQGTADDVWMSIAHAACRLAIKVVEGAVPQSQVGEASLYRRRKDNVLPQSSQIDQVHRHIQMLDGEGYPGSHVDHGNLRITFSRSSLRDGHVLCDAVITLRSDCEDTGTSSPP